MSALLRLLGWGWTLVRLDALLPREAAPYAPPPLRALAAPLRLLASGAARRLRPGQRLALAFERSGPVAIKFGQLLSTRGDILGRAVAEDLGRLRDALPPFPLDEALRAVAQTLDRPVDSLFAEVGPPVAAASLAQAHPARLRDGRRVALKVLRPGVERRVAADARALRLAARWTERLLPAARRLEPRALVETVLAALSLELDLRLEAAAADEVGAAMKQTPWMRAPAVVWDGVGRRALTLEWAEGMPLSQDAALEQPGIDRPALADALTRGFLSQALDHGVFHADLHEGNLFVAPPARLTAVDFGIVGRIGPGERRYLAGILYGFLRRDYPAVAALHFEAGYVPADQDPAIFAQALRAVGEPIFGRPAREVSMGRLLTQLFEVTARFGMHLRPELVLLQKTMVTVEGVARRIDPGHDIWTAADPVVRAFMNRELNPATRLRTLAAEAADLLAAAARVLRDEDARRQAERR